MIKSFSSALLLCGGILFFTAAYTPGKANNDPPRPFAPWMSISHNPLYQPPETTAESAGLAGATSRRFADAKTITNQPAISPADTLAFIEAGETGKAQPSPIEAAYAKRIVDELSQFGYDLFDTPNVRADNAAEGRYALPAGAVQDDFLLNIGDRLEITFRGQREESDTFTINSQGQIILSGLPPIAAAGLSLIHI